MNAWTLLNNIIVSKLLYTVNNNKNNNRIYFVSMVTVKIATG